MKPKILLLFYFRSQGFRKSLQYIVKLTIKIIRCDDLCSTKDPKKLLLRIKVWKTFFVQYFKLFNIVTNCDKFSVVWQFWWSHKKKLISIVREIDFFFYFFFFTLKVVKHWDRLPRKVVDSPCFGDATEYGPEQPVVADPEQGVRLGL